MKHDLDIFSYTSYRAFLRDLYESKKVSQKNFSHRVFVRICGFSSPNFLKLVMDGKRNLGKKAQQKLIETICNNKIEKEYFSGLINFEQAKTIDEKNESFLLMSQLKHRKHIKSIDVDQYEYLSSWHNVAIRELVSFKEFKEDSCWINAKLGTNLSERAIKKSIDMLAELGVLKRDESGRLVQSDANVVCAPKVFSIAVSNYHKEMLQKASEAIEDARSKDRDISALTVSLDRETFEKIVDEIKEFREKIHHTASTAKGRDVIYQIGFQLFNLSEVIW